MKFRKKIIVLLFIIILCGCSKVTSNVTVDPDGKVTENVIFDEKTSDMGKDAERAKENMELAINNYDTVLNVRNYKYEVKTDKNNSKATIKNSFDNICSYFENTIFSKYVYNKIDCTENDEYIEIKNITEYIPYCAECSDFPALGNVTFNLKLPIGAEENNADSVDNLTYTWKFGKSTDKSKTFYIKINKQQLETEKQEYIEYKKQEKILNEQKKKKQNIIIICVATAAIAIASILLFIKYKKNKVEY